MSKRISVPRIDLQALAGAERYAQSFHMEGLDLTVTTELPGKKLRFLAASRRLLGRP